MRSFYCGNARLRMDNTTYNRFWYDILTIKRKIARLHWGTCSECGGRIKTVRQEVDFGPVIIKRVPVGECQTCGANYYDLFLGGELGLLAVYHAENMSILRLINWR